MKNLIAFINNHGLEAYLADTEGKLLVEEVSDTGTQFVEIDATVQAVKNWLGY